MAEHVVLVAFSIEAKSRDEAYTILTGTLPQPGDAVVSPVSYWIAEDDRPDDSDDGSAIFVEPGLQATASQLLHQFGYCSGGSVIYDQPIPQNRRRKNKFKFA